MIKQNEAKQRKIVVNIDSTYKYVQLWNGIFTLTDKELTILSNRKRITDTFCIYRCTNHY